MVTPVGEVADTVHVWLAAISPIGRTIVTVNELTEILKALRAGTISRAEVIERMVQAGEIRQEAELTVAIELGESRGDVLDGETDGSKGAQP